MRIAFIMIAALALSGCNFERDNAPSSYERKQAMEWCMGEASHRFDKVAADIRIACTEAVYGG